MANKSKSKPDGGLRKDGTSRRSRAGNNGRGQGTPPIMIAALVVVVVGAALLFWPKGGPDPTGIGEQQSVVTVPDSISTARHMPSTEAPRSGDVDITQQGGQLTPEKPVGEAAISEAAKKQETISVTKSVPKSTPKSRNISKPVVPPIQPRPEGSWAVQTGGFGNAANADKEAGRLENAGWKAMVRAGGNSQGDMVYRVWIGYFASRDEAGGFIKQNRKKLVDAFVVHR